MRWAFGTSQDKLSVRMYTMVERFEGFFMTQLIFDYVLCHHTTHFYVSTFDYTTKLDMELHPVLLILTGGSF